MTSGLPDWVTVLTAIFVLLGSILTLIGAVGLLRFNNFYARAHAPTLGTTLGIGCVLIASILYFSVLQSRPVFHEVLIMIFMMVTTPITLMLLVNAALHRNKDAGKDHKPFARTTD
ncbi:monovalent cation/H(+) antiporter subunit G [Hyphomicrobium sp. DMF-1]|uniref:monovalent cation/H(+) antiporter subunit G n=1 Tax=Hyphomicrobium sp. DMF-1 TaxID=3019544 RepID=UPI0022EBCF5E|nr:monovalent cation/H(+) antiporter subunit G [Hyphomicrobium sp. DMF-1]WBT37708.1 monovalent cation/H(+) antiporter subunit G [Hyphomicrobium sp. DMF-1]